MLCSFKTTRTDHHLCSLTYLESSHLLQLLHRVTRLNAGDESAVLCIILNSSGAFYPPSERKLFPSSPSSGQNGDFNGLSSLSEHEAMTPPFPGNAASRACCIKSSVRTGQRSMQQQAAGLSVSQLCIRRPLVVACCHHTKLFGTKDEDSSGLYGTDSLLEFVNSTSHSGR